MLGLRLIHDSERIHQNTWTQNHRTVTITKRPNPSAMAWRPSDYKPCQSSQTRHWKTPQWYPIKASSKLVKKVMCVWTFLMKNRKKLVYCLYVDWILNVNRAKSAWPHWTTIPVPYQSTQATITKRPNPSAMAWRPPDYKPCQSSQTRHWKTPQWYPIKASSKLVKKVMCVWTFLMKNRKKTGILSVCWLDLKCQSSEISGTPLNHHTGTLSKHPGHYYKTPNPSAMAWRADPATSHVIRVTPGTGPFISAPYHCVRFTAGTPCKGINVY